MRMIKNKSVFLFYVGNNHYMEMNLLVDVFAGFGF